MTKQHKRRGAAGAAVLLIGAGAWYFHRVPAPRHQNETAEAADARRWRGFSVGQSGFASLPGVKGGGATGAPGALPPEVLEKQVATGMDAWRSAILSKQADVVISMDQAFAAAPGLYGPALVKLAETDPDDRVRAFSTRVLGKLKNVELADVLQKLLADRSPYVRQNAAWALGELATRPEGRQAAQTAVSELQRVEEADPAQDVRAAAAIALKGLQ